MRSTKPRRWGERLIEGAIKSTGIATIVFVLLIFVFLLKDSLPLFGHAKQTASLLGTRWLPTSEPEQFGLIPLLLGSLYVTLGAMVISVPLGVACAIFIAELAPQWLRELLKPLVELLAAVPSVVFGALGVLLLGPWFAKTLHLPVGQFAALGSLLLAFMAIPTIVSVSEDALHAVPRALRAGSLALGATHWQSITRVVLPTARSGLIAAGLLGLGRAIGETMTVLMVTGNAAVIPQGLKGFILPVRTMTATIAAEMGETAHNSTHYFALFFIGLLLFLITLVVNVVAEVVVHRMGREAK
ncbi:MAG: phosphate ABC transporter permease subunit PstC [Armatimonadetes bacterium]|nr:phosphate ABC transporter permease subunit PstC [Armatimonadota bacterium]